jgi:Calcium binding
MTSRTRPTASNKPSQQKGLAAARLDGLIEEATVDAYGESEQTTGFFTMFEEHLAVPFKAEVLGMEVTVERIDMTDDEQIVAVCVRGKSRQRIPITELPVPASPPRGWEWIDAYRRWVRGR